MSKSFRLMSTTAMLLVAGMSFASAQSVSREAPAPAAPNAQSPSVPKAGAQQRPEQSMPQKRGAEQRGDRDRPQRQANPKGSERDQTTGQSEPRGAEHPTGQAPGDMKRGQKDDAKGAPTQSNERGQQNERVQQNERGQRDQPNKGVQRQQEQPKQGAQRGQQAPDQTQGQGSHANISTEQRTRIRETIIKESNAPRVNNVNFNVSVGTVVPRTVRLAPVPVTIVEVMPAWRGYVYFVVGDDIIVVEPGSHRIVAVIAA